MLDDLEAEAFKPALALLESVVDRPLLEALLLLLEAVPDAFRVAASVPEVVSVPLEAEPPFAAFMLFAVVPLEAELSLPLVPLVLLAVLLALPACPPTGAATVLPVELVLSVELEVAARLAPMLPVEECVFAEVAFRAELPDFEAVADKEPVALFEDDWSAESDPLELFAALFVVESDPLELFEDALSVESEALELFAALWFVDRAAFSLLDEDLLAAREFDLLALTSSDSLLVLLLSIARVLVVAWLASRLLS